MMRTFMACVAALLAASGVSRGEDLKTNEPTPGRISKEGDSQVWVVEVPDNATIHFEVICKTGKLQVELFRDGKTKLELSGVNGKGWPPHGAPWVYMGDREESLEAQSKKLAAGRYTIKVSGRERSEVGPYFITLLDPVFKPKSNQENPETKTERLARLKKELDSLSQEIMKLEAELKKK